jgi:hypothetical protein
MKKPKTHLSRHPFAWISRCMICPAGPEGGCGAALGPREAGRLSLSWFSISLSICAVCVVWSGECFETS